MRPIFVASLIIFLTSCGGFQPLYKKTDSTSLNIPKQFEKIKIALIKDRKGQILRNHLLDIFNPKGQPKDPEYLLRIELKESVYQTATKRDATFTRSNITNRAEFRLDIIEARQTVLSSMSHTTSSFDLIQDDLANTQALIASRDANLRILSQRIASRIAFAILSQAKEKNIFQSMNVKLANNKVSGELGAIFLRNTNPEGVNLSPKYVLYLSASEINKQKKSDELYIKNLASYRLVDLKKKRNLLEEKSRISDTIHLKGNDDYDNEAIKSTRENNLNFLADKIEREILSIIISKKKLREEEEEE